MTLGVNDLLGSLDTVITWLLLYLLYIMYSRTCFIVYKLPPNVQQLICEDTEFSLYNVFVVVFIYIWLTKFLNSKILSSYIYMAKTKFLNSFNLSSIGNASKIQIYICPLTNLSIHPFTTSHEPLSEE